jgi:hypothetical protein
MRIRSLKLGLVAALATLAGTAALSAPSFAAPSTIYCLNGVSTTLPATISASSVSAGSSSTSFSEASALEAISLSGGVFYYGYVSSGPFVPGWYLSRAPGIPVATSYFEPGYTTNTVGLGACVATASPAVTNVGVCKLLPRGDGTTGLFQQIPLAQWNDSESRYFDAPAANWVEGLGLTCDNPVALGYRAAGYSVAWGGKRDPAHDPKGVRGSGFNDIYPYFTK